VILSADTRRLRESFVVASNTFRSAGRPGLELRSRPPRLTLHDNRFVTTGSSVE
jgi:hypothetical protein